MRWVLQVNVSQPVLDHSHLIATHLMVCMHLHVILFTHECEHMVSFSLKEAFTGYILY